MARPRKYRNVCGFPDNSRFGPLGMEEHENKFIIMPIDQYETVRLIDLEGLTQEECAVQMNIARTTVQRIYSEARKNLAEALVEGKVLKIEGGDYKLCNGKGKFCGRGNCQRHRFNVVSLKEKESERKLMKIAIPVNDKEIKAEVSSSFGRATYFLIYDVEAKESIFVNNEAVSSPGGAGIIAAQTVVDSKVDVLIAPRCGQNAADVLNAGKIKLYKNIDGTVEDNIKAFTEEKLNLLEDIHAGFHKHGEK